MKNVKRNILSLVAKVGVKAALKSAGAASTYSYHQPKEPSAIKALKK